MKHHAMPDTTLLSQHAHVVIEFDHHITAPSPPMNNHWSAIGLGVQGGEAPRSPNPLYIVKHYTKWVTEYISCLHHTNM